jgi:DNA-binding response OmpR family regulator/DNA-binding CsgD family transcriptional regulator
MSQVKKHSSLVVGDTPEQEISQTILVVDDTPENLRLLASLLTEQNYKVRLATSGSHALISVQKDLPDLILLDIMMPDLGGYELCQQLKAVERTQAIPIIFISALDDVFDKVTAFSVGGVDYITKPFQAAEVLARVKTHLTIHQLQQELHQKNQALYAANETLEEKVQARTVELAQANEALQTEIEQRIRHQAEKDRLFDVVNQQSEQLRQLTNWLIETQQRERQGLASGLQLEIAQNIALLQSDLHLVQTMLSPAHDRLISIHLENAFRALDQMSEYTQHVATNLHQAAAHEQNLSETPLLKLTAREREVLRLIAQGKTNAEIADILTVAITTVHTYTGRIKEKLDIPNLPGLIKFAIEHNLAE